MGIKTESAIQGAKAGSMFGPVGTALGAGLGYLQGDKAQSAQQSGSMLDAYNSGLQSVNDQRNEALRMDDTDKKAIMDSFNTGWGIY